MAQKRKRSQEKRITRVAQIVRYMRVSRKISQRDAARLIGVSEQAIGHYENGRMDISEARLEQMLRAYGYAREEFAAYRNGKEITVDFKAECTSILNQLDETRLRLVYGVVSNFVGPKPSLYS